MSQFGILIQNFIQYNAEFKLFLVNKLKDKLEPNINEISFYTRWFMVIFFWSNRKECIIRILSARTLPPDSRLIKYQYYSDISIIEIRLF